MDSGDLVIPPLTIPAGTHAGGYACVFIEVPDDDLVEDEEEFLVTINSITATGDEFDGDFDIILQFDSPEPTATVTIAPNDVGSKGKACLSVFTTYIE